MKQYKIEQVNPNDDEFKIIEVHVKEGAKVSKDEIILTVEGQKTSFDVVAEDDGLVSLLVECEEYYGVDQFVFVIFDDEKEYLEKNVNQESVQHNSVAIQKSDGKRELSSDTNVEALERGLVDGKFRIGVIFGGKAIRQIEDVLSCSKNVEIVSIFDDKILESDLYAGDTSIENIILQKSLNALDGFFVATGNKFLRAKLYNRLKKNNIKLINIIHPSAIISNNSVLGDNVYIGPGVVVSSKSFIDSCCFISALCNIEHHSVIKANTLLGPGVVLSGSVIIGKNSILSAGVSIESNVTVGDNVFITAGYGINKHIKDDERLL